MRVGILHNPLSGRNRRNPNLIPSVRVQFPEVFCAEVKTPDDIRQALETFAEQEVQCVVIVGGDGTVQATMGALLYHCPFQPIPWLALFPAGTANLMAGDVGLGKFERATLERFLRYAKNHDDPPRCETRPILRIRFPEEREPLHGMFFGAGAIYHGTKMGLDTKGSIGRLGEWGAGLIVIRFLWALATGSRKGLETIRVQVTADGITQETQEYLVLLITTLNRLFLGMKPFWNHAPSPLRYTALRVPYQYLWRVLPTLLCGQSHPLATKEHGYISEKLLEVRLVLDGGFILDGEVYTSSKPHEPLILDSPGELSFVRL